MQDLLIVFSNPVDNRVEDFNDWYTNVHIRDVMRMPASVAVQRFVLADQQPLKERASKFAYLAVYETDDTVKCTVAHAAAFTPGLPISDAFPVDAPCNYFRLRSFITSDPVAKRDGDIVVVEFSQAANFSVADASRLIEMAGVLSIAHLAVLGDQIIPREPTRPEIVMIRLTGEPVPELAHQLGRLFPADAIISRYEALIPRLTADDVLSADDGQAAVEAKSRAALEGKQHMLPV